MGRWTGSECADLAQAWIAASEDPIVGIDLLRRSFVDHIALFQARICAGVIADSDASLAPDAVDTDVRPLRWLHGRFAYAGPDCFDTLARARSWSLLPVDSYVFL